MLKKINNYIYTEKSMPTKANEKNNSLQLLAVNHNVSITPRFH